jgi:hypothetical protein
MLFPTCFYVYLHQMDYGQREQTFAQTVKETANKFHRHIQSKMVKYTDYIPHATYWRFQFLPFKEGEIIADKGKDKAIINQKEIFVLSSIYSTDFAKGNIGMANIVATKHNKGSNTMDRLNVNRDALRGIDALAKTILELISRRRLKELPKTR